MKFPFSFTRYVGTLPVGGITLGADVVPTSGGIKGPNVSNAAAAGNLIEIPPYDVNGNPISVLAVAVSLPATATPITLDFYFYEETLGVWLLNTNMSGGTFGDQTISVLTSFLVPSRLPPNGNPGSISYYVRASTSQGSPPAGKFIVAFCPMNGMSTAGF